MCQEASLENEFNLIEAEGRGVHKQVHIRIQVGNLGEDVVEVLIVKVGIVLAVEFGNHITKIEA